MLDCMLVAHRKYGCGDGVEAARLKALARHRKAQATQADNLKRRRWVQG